MIDFPANPTVGQIFTSGGMSWTWDGTKWVASTLTTPPRTWRNRIINGNMSVDQRNAGNVIAAPTAITYVIDRWKLNTSIASKGNCGQVFPNGAAGITATGQLYSLIWTTTAAYTPAAADGLSWLQVVEGCNFNDANWGTVNALPVVLEFWASSSLTGTFAGALRDNAATRSYAFTFSLPVASTWTKIHIPIPGDQGGTWNVANNAAAMQLFFNLGSGSNRATAAGVWTAGNFQTALGAVNVVSTLNANFYITGVALMVNPPPNAEPDFRKFSDNLLDCQRYFVRSQIAWMGNCTAGQGVNASGYFPVFMRTSPTYILTANNSSNLTAAPAFANLSALSGVTMTGVVSATGQTAVNGNYSADADF